MMLHEINNGLEPIGSPLNAVRNRSAPRHTPGEREKDPRRLRRFTLAAIDLDGTLLGPDLGISPANLDAIVALQATGTEVVLASGRHYDSMQPFADRLPGVRWMVSSQGGEVSDVSRKVVLRRAFLDQPMVRTVLELSDRLRFSTVVYAADGVFGEPARNPNTEFYEALSGRTVVEAPRAELLAKDVFKINWIGESAEISALLGNRQIQALAMQKVRTHARILELIPSGVTKGTGLRVLAAHLGILPEDSVVFGDADNDIPMFEWAGTSVAMPHGWPAAIASATITGPDGPEATALARAVATVLRTPLEVTNADQHYSDS